MPSFAPRPLRRLLDAHPRSPSTLIGAAVLGFAMAVVLFATPDVAHGQSEAHVTDEAVDAAIRKAVAWIKSQRKHGHWEGDANEGGDEYGGDTALALLALLYAGEDPRQDEMAASLKWVAGINLKTTYTVGVRAHALALVPGQTYRNALKADMDWLTRACGDAGTPHAGGYRYHMEQAGKDSDNSASQYGVLGMWMASEAGHNVGESYWQLVEEFWMAGQNNDGGWSYQRSQNKDGQSTGSMTAAGLATLFVCLDKVHARDEGAFNGTSSPLCGKHKEAGALLSALQRGLEWFGREFSVKENPKGESRWRTYYLYGVERTGRASGRKYFSDRDWFRAGAAELIATQGKDGSWQGSDSQIRDTAFSLMFLCHGSAPLFMNKLEHGDDWNNKVRDIAGITRYAEKSFERLLNWQVVRLSGPITDLLEAPIVYMSGHTKWEFDDTEVEKLREYCQRGGLVLGVACCSSEDFANGYRELASRMFPDWQFKPMEPTHPLLSRDLQTEIKDPPPLLELGSGARTMMILAPKDICAPWNQNRIDRWRHYFDLACNLYLYATDKTSIRSRLQTSDIPVKQTSITRTVNVARIKYDGFWDPEPYGWTRLAHYLNNEAGVRLEVTSPVTLDSPQLKDFKIAHMTGTGAFELSEAEKAGLRKFLFGGGTLIADAAGGSQTFADSLEKHLNGIIKQNLVYLDKDAAVMSGAGIPGGVTLDNIGYKRVARSESRAHKFPRIKSHNIARRQAVFVLPLDISVGLLGTHVYNTRGYDAESSLRIARNLLLYSSLSTAEKAKLDKAPAAQGP